MKNIICFVFTLFLLSDVGHASEVRIKLKDNTLNSTNEVFMSISGDFEHNRYLIRPVTTDGNHISAYDSVNRLWGHNNDLWTNQTLVENIQLLKFTNVANDEIQLQFELLDLETSTKYNTTKLTIYSNREKLNYLNALNQNLQKW